MADELINRSSIYDPFIGQAPQIGYQNQAISNYYNQNPLTAGQHPGYAPDAQGFADLASTLGAFSKGEKADRSLKGDWTQNYDQLMLSAQQARERAESDALSKLAKTGYLKSGGAPYTPATLNLGGKPTTLPSFGFGPKAPSDRKSHV